MSGDRYSPGDLGDNSVANRLVIEQDCSAPGCRAPAPLCVVVQHPFREAGYLQFAAGSLKMFVGPRGKKPRRRANRSRGGLGLVLAAIALLLQIAIPSSHPPGQLGLANEAGDLSAAFDEHALCLSGDRSTADDPSDHAPKPLRHKSAACCFWHGNMGLALSPGANLELVAFSRTCSVFTPRTTDAVRRLTGTIGARAPPMRT